MWRPLWLKKFWKRGKFYMVDPKIHEINQWLVKAKNDLLSAELLFKANPPLLDTAVYHCQQVAEKALKAFLTYKEIPFQKIHHLTVLVEQSMEVDSTFEKLLDIADILTPYAVAFRYPGDVLEPEYDDVVEALEVSRTVLVFVLSKIPDISR